MQVNAGKKTAMSSAGPGAPTVFITSTSFIGRSWGSVWEVKKVLGKQRRFPMFADVWGGFFLVTQQCLV